MQYTSPKGSSEHSEINSNLIWLPVNHSNTNITFTAVSTAEAKAIATLCTEHYSHLISEPYKITRIQHAKFSKVYRVSPNQGDDLILKIIENPELLPTTQWDVSLQALYNQHHVSSNFGKKIIESGIGHIVARPFTQGIDSGEVSHFTGKSLFELESVGKRLSSINQCLQEQSNLCGTPPKQNNSILPVHEARDIIDKLTRLKSKKTIHIHRSEVVNYMVEKLHYMEEKLHCITDNLNKLSIPNTNNSNNKVLLVDVHPHQIFVNTKGECISIIDFKSANDQWSESVVMYALHRTVREFIRKQLACNHTSSENSIIKLGIKAFLDGYISEQPNRGKLIAKEVADNGPNLIRYFLFSKMLKMVKFDIDEHYTPLYTIPSTHRLEMTKVFSRYLSEIDCMEPVLREYCYSAF